MTGLAPVGDRFFNEPRRRVVLRKKIGLSVHQLGRISFERFSDLRMQLLSGAAQQAAMCRVLYQRVFEGIDRVGWHAALEDQLGGDEPAKSTSQLVVGKTGDGTQERVREFAANCGSGLRHTPD